jgi:hypothetical protein
VLLTPGGLVEGAEAEANAIRYNMSRVRKVVGVGSELETLPDLERVLRPLLPIKPTVLAIDGESALALLPDMLASESLPADAIRAATEAFRNSRPIVQAIFETGDEP